MTDIKTLKKEFWKTLSDSPFLFLQLDSDPHTAVPMTAQLDPDADGEIWFFTSKDQHFAKGGSATATFAGKDHDMFARFTGFLHREPGMERRKKMWSKSVEAWFPNGLDDPNLVMLRMELGSAEIWNSDLGFYDNAKQKLGFDIRDKAKKEHAETLL